MNNLDYPLHSGEAGGINNPDFLKEVAAFTEWMRAQPEVTYVRSLTDTIMLFDPAGTPTQDYGDFDRWRGSTMRMRRGACPQSRSSAVRASSTSPSGPAST